jgi:hypothetical protein
MASTDPYRIPGAEPAGVPPEETPQGEAGATRALTVHREERRGGWGPTPTLLILVSALIVVLGLVTMAVTHILD